MLHVKGLNAFPTTGNNLFFPEVTEHTNTISNDVRSYLNQHGGVTLQGQTASLYSPLLFSLYAQFCAWESLNYCNSLAAEG